MLQRHINLDTGFYYMRNLKVELNERCKKNFVNKKCQKNFLSTEMGKIIEYWIII